MKLFYIAIISSLMYGCVSGAPKLTQEQRESVKNVSVYKKDDSVPSKYSVVGDISAANCSGAPYGGRIWGNAEKAIETLKEKAVSLGADGVVNTSCSVAPFVNNCWTAKKCSGTAVKFK